MTVQIHLDDRLRTVAAALAASSWPEREQALKPYKPHRVAERAVRALAPHRSHPAPRQMDAMIGRRGQGLAEAFAQALDATTPLGVKMTHFGTRESLSLLWAGTADDWAQALQDAGEVLDSADLDTFLAEVFGPLDRSLVLFPNLLFPATRTVVLDSPDGWLALLPPPLAWGTSSPWRYNERPDEVLGELCLAYARAIYTARQDAGRPALWPHPRAAALLGRAVAVNFLRQAIDEAAARSYMVIETKTGSYLQLPEVVGAVGSHLEAVRAGEASGLGEHLASLPV